jgi:hypothetical protein
MGARVIRLGAIVLVLTSLAIAAPREDGIQIASYYFPNYHPDDARNAKLKGPGWSEWELVKNAHPRFEGHHQPNVPAWGYVDESDPGVMAKKIDAAADHAIDAFIFDWYFYDDGPFLQRAIEQGFMKAANVSRLKFALMWANHDWIDIHPHAAGTTPKLLYPGKITPQTFERMTDMIIRAYFKHPSYWMIDGRPYFSIYEVDKLIASFGSVQATRAALDSFRANVKAAGFPGIHLNAIVPGGAILPGEKVALDLPKLVRELGFDSVGSYVWVHHVALKDFPATDYVWVRDNYIRYWEWAEKTYTVPYYPNVTMGWDPSPRARQSDPYTNSGYPFMATMQGNTPEQFRESLRISRDRLMKRPRSERILSINCLNEWTEGSYLEPDEVNGMKYLEAITDVFK